MNDNCRDCINSENFKNDIERLRNDVKDIYDRLGAVETTVARKEEQIETIFNILNEIKDSIKDIGNKLCNLEQKPADNADKIKYIFLTALISSGVGAFLSFMATHIK